MVTILDEILVKLPRDAMISGTAYEWANIVLYTKNRAFFHHGFDSIKQLVDEFKKRIELRADATIRMDTEKTEKFIRKTIPEDAEMTQILFEPARSVVTIESKRPGAAIGRDGELLKAIKEETLWIPIVRRESIIPSKITTNIRKVLYEDSEYRRKFLDNIGKRIYEQRQQVDEMWARVSFLGGGRQVGRSCLYLQTPQSKVLLDCGINVAAQGKYAFPYMNAPEFHIEDVDAVIISHSHLDHCGFLPYLFKMGYRGPVYCTEATRDTMALLMLDFVEVSHGNNKDVLYSSADIKECIKHTICLEYGEVTDITPDVRITLYNAGHILGSAMVHLHLGEGWHNLLYTGDYKVKKTLLLNPAQTIFPRVETLMTESTYGASDDIMPSREECEAQILKIIKDTIERKGKVLMPTLGVGRSQEVMILLQKFCHEHNLEIPFYIDGMVWDVTAIHNAYPRFLSQEIKEKVFYENNDPLLDKMFRQVGSGKERRAVLEGPPCVIVATSGMLMGGPALSYLKELASNPKNSLVFTCYQGEGSLGSKIQKGERRLQIDEAQVDMKMEVFTISGLSGHADRNELLSYMNNIKPRPRKVIIVHGENIKTIDLASAIHKNFKVETVAPRNLEAVRLR